MATNVVDISFRHKATATLTNDTGVYALCDLDNVPIYVGQSKDGIRNRVRRHLTSARSDVIANRLIDVWEVAYVWAFPAPKESVDLLEASLYHHFNDDSSLMNGMAPRRPSIQMGQCPEPTQIVQVMASRELEVKKDLIVRIPRQISQYQALADYYVNVKSSKNVSIALDAHFQRLAEYHRLFLSMLNFDDED